MNFQQQDQESSDDESIAVLRICGDDSVICPVVLLATLHWPSEGVQRPREKCTKGAVNFQNLTERNRWSYWLVGIYQKYKYILSYFQQWYRSKHYLEKIWGRFWRPQSRRPGVVAPAPRCYATATLTVYSLRDCVTECVSLSQLSWCAANVLRASNDV